MNETIRRGAGLGSVASVAGLVVLGLGLSAVLSPTPASACDECGKKGPGAPT